MGLTNFTSGPDDDKNSGSGPPAGGNPPGFPMASASPSSGSADDEVKEMLVDYNEKFKDAEPTMFRDALIEQTLSVLISKNKPNALLTGSAGVGKTKIVEDIARRIALGDTLIPDQLADRTIYELPVTDLVSGTSYRGQLEEKIKNIIAFASNPKNKAILFIDEIHQITGASGTNSTHETRMLSQSLKPALARGEISVIGATTSTESHSLDDDPAFARRFTQLIVDELTMAQTETILASLRPGLLKHYRYQITVDDTVLSDAVTIAEENSRADQHRPDKAITLMDRAMADRILEQKRLILQAENDGDTALVQALKAQPTVPLTQNRISDVAKRLMTGNAQSKDLDVTALATALHTNLQNQDDVFDRLVDMLARQQLGLFPSTTPTTWMFAGASGVGKTETAKIISDQLTGTDPIILNMTEYHTPSDVAKIIGAPPGYVGSDSNQELPFDTLESNPHRVILLDEFEKADVAVQRLFLSAFDEGHIRNARGKVLDFSKALIICTTNAARDALSGKIVGFGDGPSMPSNRSLNTTLAQFFDAELLGRFSLIVGFNPIDEQAYREIMVAEYDRQRSRIVDSKPSLGTKLPTAVPDDEIAQMVADSYVDSQGARPARKAIRTWIEDHLMTARTTAPAVATAPVDQDC